MGYIFAAKVYICIYIGIVGVAKQMLDLCSLNLKTLKNMFFEQISHKKGQQNSMRLPNNLNVH